MRRETDLLSSIRAHQRDGCKPAGKKMSGATFAPCIPQPAWDIVWRVGKCSAGEARQEIRAPMRVSSSRAVAERATAFPFPSKAASSGARGPNDPSPAIGIFRRARLAFPSAFAIGRARGDRRLDRIFQVNQCADVCPAIVKTVATIDDINTAISCRLTAQNGAS
jgi:hypothetical protein